MGFLKILLLFIILILFFYTIYRLMQKRQALLMQRELVMGSNTDLSIIHTGGSGSGYPNLQPIMTTPSVQTPVHTIGSGSSLKHIEGFSLFGDAITNEFNSCKNDSIPVGISNILIGNANLPLKEYVVKSSFNSALTGFYLNLNMIRYVLSRGCRFLDFEIYSFDDVPYVAYAADNNFTNVDSYNKLLLGEVLNVVAASAFVAPSPNPNDPLFIHLRIKSFNAKIFDAISTIISNTIGPRLNTCDVTTDTLLSSLFGKIVLIVDKQLAPTYKNYSSCDPNKNANGCNDLTSQVNLESGGDYMRIYNFSKLLDLSLMPPYIYSDGTTDISTLRLAIPDNGTNMANPNPYEFVVDYGTQFIAYPFYVNDNNLDLYEQIFRDNKTAFVPFNTMIPYLNNLDR